MDEKKKHWETVYSRKSPEQLSWTQERPSPSIEWILEILPDRSVGVIDIGGGNSLLVDHLLDAGFKFPAVLDISSHALELAKARLGKRQAEVEWIEADITTFKAPRRFMLWHDRAVFHFLTLRKDREKYISSLKDVLAPGGKILLATFSPHGPGQCSGLSVMRFDAAALSEELGSGFKLIRSQNQTHTTPWGTNQEFVYCLFERF